MDDINICKKIKISKLDAAIRQLNTSIELYFENRDELSIHTLAAASYVIICDLLRKQEKYDLLYDTPAIKDEYRAEWINKINHAQNFLKHADKDPKESLEFNNEMSEMIILFAIGGVEKLDIDSIYKKNLHKIYLHWSMLEKPFLFKNEYIKDIEHKFPGIFEKDLNLDKSEKRKLFFTVMNSYMIEKH